MAVTELYLNSIILSGGVDLLALPDGNRVAVRIFMPSIFNGYCGPLESFQLASGMFSLLGNTPLDLLYSKLGPVIQFGVYVKGPPGVHCNAINITV